MPQEVLLSSFHLNGHTIGFHPQTQELEPPCIVLKKYRKVPFNSCHLSGHNGDFMLSLLILSRVGLNLRQLYFFGSYVIADMHHSTSFASSSVCA